MPWIRFDCSILFDDLCLSLNGDEFKAWCFLLLYVKASGARGSAPDVNNKRLANMADVPLRAVTSMLKKSGKRFVRENGRIMVSNWYRYNEEYRDRSHKEDDKTLSSGIPGDNDDKTLSSGIPGDNEERMTPHHTTPHYTTQRKDKDKSTGKNMKNNQQLFNIELWKTLTDEQSKLFCSEILQMINEENSFRENNPFVWITDHNFELDMKLLANGGGWDDKRKILIEATNMLDGVLNWPKYVRYGILYTVRSTEKQKVNNLLAFTRNILKQPISLASAISDGILSVGFRGRKRR